MSAGIEIPWAGELWRLLPEKAVWWPRAATLLLSDLHLGKASAFRAAGLPVPEGTTAADLARLDRLLAAFGPERLLLLGDLLHARSGRSEETMSAVADWRDRHRELDILLVRGNHDRAAGDPPAAWGFRCVHEPLLEGGLAFAHDACDPPAGAHAVLAGHLHPVVAMAPIRGSGVKGARAPCFWLRPHCLVLPAFGSFTGGLVITPAAGDTVFVIGDGAVVRVAARVSAARH